MEYNISRWGTEYKLVTKCNDDIGFGYLTPVTITRTFSFDEVNNNILNNCVYISQEVSLSNYTCVSDNSIILEDDEGNILTIQYNEDKKCMLYVKSIKDCKYDCKNIYDVDESYYNQLTQDGIIKHFANRKSI